MNVPPWMPLPWYMGCGLMTDGVAISNDALFAEVFHCEKLVGGTTLAIATTARTVEQRWTEGMGMDKCPHCGSKNGVYTTFTAMQYYDFNGDTAGCSLDDAMENQKVMARCLHCDRKISLVRIAREAKRKHNNGYE